ncbi:hypothetical protein [Sphingomonas endolithica]|uniref:hypothetical protein n=1 Tax=Sphingomonas endolithica TaxID=2972485 RepID=UPI0021B010A9|nr:hypothetical protein [Sphingomonas sp. ZFBP2030]
MTAARKLAALTPEAQKAVLAALDEISTPMTKIEIEDALAPCLSRSIRRPVARALAEFDIIVLRRR